MQCGCIIVYPQVELDGPRKSSGAGQSLQSPSCLELMSLVVPFTSSIQSSRMERRFPNGIAGPDKEFLWDSLLITLPMFRLCSTLELSTSHRSITLFSMTTSLRYWQFRPSCFGIKSLRGCLRQVERGTLTHQTLEQRMMLRLSCLLPCYQMIGSQRTIWSFDARQKVSAKLKRCLFQRENIKVIPLAPLQSMFQRELSLNTPRFDLLDNLVRKLGKMALRWTEAEDWARGKQDFRPHLRCPQCGNGVSCQLRCLMLAKAMHHGARHLGFTMGDCSLPT